MDAVLFLKEKARMTNDCSISCIECPLCLASNELDITCSDLENKHSKEVVEIVEKWSRENPVKNMMNDFFEKFPNAPKKNNNEPWCCPHHCGYAEDNSCNVTGCLECWSRPLEVKE